MSELYSLTQKLVECQPEVVVRTECHDPADPESPDIIWIIEYSDGGMCEGEYLTVEPFLPASAEWHVAHQSADVCGGHPTYWGKTGHENELLPVVAEYLAQRAGKLKA